METVAFDLSKYFSQRLAKMQQNKTINLCLLQTTIAYTCQHTYQCNYNWQTVIAVTGAVRSGSILLVKMFQ